MKILDNSFTKAILISRCEFSITFAASATLIVGAECVPAVITDAYTSSTIRAISGVDPDVTFLIFSVTFLYDLWYTNPCVLKTRIEYQMEEISKYEQKERRRPEIIRQGI